MIPYQADLDRMADDGCPHYEDLMILWAFRIVENGDYETLLHLLCKAYSIPIRILTGRNYNG